MFGDRTLNWGQWLIQPVSARQRQRQLLAPPQLCPWKRLRTVAQMLWRDIHSVPLSSTLTCGVG